MDSLDPSATPLLPLLPYDDFSALSQLAPSLLLADATTEGWGEMGLLANLTGESSASIDLYTANIATTGGLAVGDSITAYVNVQRDRDWFRLSLTAGESYLFKLDAFNPNQLNCLLSLRNSSGVQITSNNDSNGTLNSEIRWTATSSGTYFLDAGGSSNRTSGQYQLSATRVIQSPGFNATTGYGEASVERAVEALLATSLAEVTNQFTGGLYGIDRIGAPEVWAAGYRGEGIVVAVVDTGVDRNHVDLDANTWINAAEIAGDGLDNDSNGYIDDIYGWNFHDGSANTLDNNNHGTHVAGIIAAEDNGVGIIGVANQAKIMAVKVLSATGSGSLTNVARGIRYAADQGANVINLSLGGSGSLELLDAVRYAWTKGSAVIMAAGNDGLLSPGYPAAYANQYGLAIGAIDTNGILASFSNRAGATQIDYITAAGVGVYSSIRGGGYSTFSGTSMATPHVAGGMALLMQANKQSGQNRTIAQLETLLTSSASNNLIPITSNSLQSPTTGSTNAFSTHDLALSPDKLFSSLVFGDSPILVQPEQVKDSDSNITIQTTRLTLAWWSTRAFDILTALAPSIGMDIKNTAADSVTRSDSWSASKTPETLSAAAAHTVDAVWAEAPSSVPIDAPSLDPLTGLWARPWQLSA